MYAINCVALQFFQINNCRQVDNKNVEMFLLSTVFMKTSAVKVRASKMTDALPS